MVSPYSAVPGAVMEEGRLMHCGNPLREQRLLAEGDALAPLQDRAVLAVSGEDRLTWLDSVSSQALSRLQPGESTETLILSPQGHVEHAASVVDDGDTTWLIVDAHDAETFLAWLMRMKFRLRVAPRDATDEFSVFGGTRDALARAFPDAVCWIDPWPTVSTGGHGYANDHGHGGATRDWGEALVTLEQRDALVSRASAGEMTLAGGMAAEALRIAAWRPRLADLDERTLPHEVDWLRTAVHLSKGCYRGQETVAKVHNLGHPPRRIVLVDLDGSGSELPQTNAEILIADATVGVIRVAALHYEDGPIALGIVKRNAARDTPARIAGDSGSIAAQLVTIVPPEAGAEAAVPRLPKLGRRTATK